MDPIRTELPVHIFRLYATRKKDITHDKYAGIMNLLPKRNRTENQQKKKMALHSNRIPSFCVLSSFSLAYVCKLGQLPDLTELFRTLQQGKRQQKELLKSPILATNSFRAKYAEEYCLESSQLIISF
jgi:hypothetical protein